MLVLLVLLLGLEGTKTDHASVSSKISVTSSRSDVCGGAHGTMILTGLRTNGVIVGGSGKSESTGSCASESEACIGKKRARRPGQVRVRSTTSRSSSLSSPSAGSASVNSSTLAELDVVGATLLITRGWIRTRCTAGALRSCGL